MSRTKKLKPMIIKATDIKVSIGHQSHITGTGFHDLRPKRKRTRATQTREAIKEYS